MFREITIEDKILFDQFHCEEYCGSELLFANVFAWKKTDCLQLSIQPDFLIIKGRDFFFPPLCKTKESFLKGISWIEQYCLENAFPFRLLGITDLFYSFFGEDYFLLPTPHLDEYLYLPNDLATYPGKKYHAKRNLCNQFQKNYSYQFVSYKTEHFSPIIDLCNRWEVHKTPTEELDGIIDILNNLSASGCFCDVLIVNDIVEGFVIGTVQKKCGIVLFEKANVELIGIYPMLISLTSQKHFLSMEKINRQEDMGIESLRQAKMRFHPVQFIKKYQVCWNKTKQLKYLYQSAFPDSQDYVNYFFTKKEKETLILEEDSFIYAALYYRTLTIHIQGQLHSACFIFAISTHPHYRNRGYMKNLLNRAVDEWQKEYLCCFLLPDISNFYEKFDFVPCYYLLESADCKKVETNDWEKIKELYNLYAKKYQNFIIRSDKQWQTMAEENQINHGKVYLLFQAENIIGYEIFDGETTIELVDLSSKVTLSPRCNMVRFLQIETLQSLFPKEKSYPLTALLQAKINQPNLLLQQFSIDFIKENPILILDCY